LSDPEGDNEIVLGIDELGRYFINGKAVPEGTLEDQLRSLYARHTGDKILYFKADNKLRYAKIQEAVETARKAGVRVLAAVTEPDQKVELGGGGGS
ncbi:MAG TPA: biopolymer transporter ExbD, partial [Gemmatimonadales bacterium]|nr:biopolymer transporter ExbD [Gemmatimonadales bacterium]